MMKRWAAILLIGVIAMAAGAAQGRAASAIIVTGAQIVRVVEHGPVQPGAVAAGGDVVPRIRLDTAQSARQIAISAIPDGLWTALMDVPLKTKVYLPLVQR